jgi:hypothetical protein
VAIGFDEFQERRGCRQGLARQAFHWPPQ